VRFPTGDRLGDQGDRDEEAHLADEDGLHEFQCDPFSIAGGRIRRIWAVLNPKSSGPGAS
jgi:hypothetical protein